MVQRGRRAVYDPQALAFEKPTPEIETEYRRKVRMFEHCWLIVLRGKMLRRLPAGYFVEIVSHRHLRYGSGLLHLVVLGTNVALVALRAGLVYDVLLGCQLAFLVLRGGVARAAALLRARHLGDGRLALELPAAGRSRDVGSGRGDAVMEVDEHVRASLIKTHGNLYRGVELDALPDTAVPAAGREGARAARRRLQLGPLDDRRRARRLVPDRDRPGEEVGRGGAARGRTARGGGRVRGRGRPRAAVRGRSLRRGLLVQRPPAPGARTTCRGWSRRFAGCCGPAASSGSRCRTRGGALNLVRQARRGFSRVAVRTSATGRSRSCASCSARSGRSRSPPTAS